MFKSQEIAELQGKITKLEAELKTATDGKVLIQAELDTAKADLATASTKAATQEATINDLNGKLTAAEAAQKAAEAKAAAAEASVQQQVTNALAAAGVDPVRRDPSAKVGDDGKEKMDASLPPMKRAAAAMKGTWKIFGDN
ncbi:hypothetical protein [Prosthecobacter sp.]|uniref:hypothetical protein n=1 Tax=Prosthecobacter sp. TaxID=1965333 RepID=UPI00378463A3